MSSLSGPHLATIESVAHNPQADKLDVLKIEGCLVIAGRDEFVAGEEVIFVPFDSILPKEGPFPASLLGQRIRPKRLRGIFSMGLALKNTWGFSEADDIGTALGITKWEPGVEVENSSDGCEASAPPGIVVSKYDLESLRKCHANLTIGEEVVITEKLHGASARFVYVDGKLHVGSRGRWLKEETGGMWWDVANRYDLEAALSSYSGMVLFGEIYGQVQDLKYEAKSGEVFFKAFDVYDTAKNTFWGYEAFRWFCGVRCIPTVPILYRGPWKGFESHAHLAEGSSKLAQNIREGFVVKPAIERVDPFYGRIAYKLHGEGYLLRKEKES